MLKDKIPKQSSNHSAGSGPAAAVATIRLNQSGGCYDWMPVTLAVPDAYCPVIAWRSSNELPCAAYFDAEEQCWFSQHDGARIEDVTDWMHYLTPTGVDSGSCMPMSTTAGATRVAEIKRLAEQANTISAQMNSAIQILQPDQQSEAVLDCLSLADDFVRDLDVLAGAPA